VTELCPWVCGPLLLAHPVYTDGLRDDWWRHVFTATVRARSSQSSAGSSSSRDCQLRRRHLPTHSGRAATQLRRRTSTQADPHQSVLTPVHTARPARRDASLAVSSRHVGKCELGILVHTLGMQALKQKTSFKRFITFVTIFCSRE